MIYWILNTGSGVGSEKLDVWEKWIKLIVSHAEVPIWSIVFDSLYKWTCFHNVKTCFGSRIFEGKMEKEKSWIRNNMKWWIGLDEIRRVINTHSPVFLGTHGTTTEWSNRNPVKKFSLKIPSWVEKICLEGRLIMMGEGMTGSLILTGLLLVLLKTNP